MQHAQDTGTAHSVEQHSDLSRIALGGGRDVDILGDDDVAMLIPLGFSPALSRGSFPWSRDGSAVLIHSRAGSCTSCAGVVGGASVPSLVLKILLGGAYTSGTTLTSSITTLL